MEIEGSPFARNRDRARVGMRIWRVMVVTIKECCI